MDIQPTRSENHRLWNPLVEWVKEQVSALWLSQTVFVYKGWSPGIVVMEGDLHSRGCGFKSQHQILDVQFSHYTGTIVMFILKKTKNKRNRGRGWPIYQKFLFTMYRLTLKINYKRGRRVDNVHYLLLLKFTLDWSVFSKKLFVYYFVQRRSESVHPSFLSIYLSMPGKIRVDLNDAFLYFNTTRFILNTTDRERCRRR